MGKCAYFHYIIIIKILGHLWLIKNFPSIILTFVMHKNWSMLDNTATMCNLDIVLVYIYFFQIWCLLRTDAMFNDHQLAKLLNFMLGCALPSSSPLGLLTLISSQSTTYKWSLVSRVSLYCLHPSGSGLTCVW